VLALGLGEPLLGVARDLASQLPHGQLPLQQVHQPPELGRDRVELEQLCRALSGSGTTEPTK
jgi:hypothetical protein